ncbi:MAG TPA: hydantoinase/oxoprolinase family protein [Conexibacter sp.]|nr:hydantoinase/oxoprolinase family protein [Conexibacter sp.]
MALRIGVDIGGTFTDLTVVDDGGRTLLVWKEDTTHGRYADAIKRGLQAIAGELGRTLGELLGEVGVFVHGSTIATNMLIERNGPTIGLVATEGFRDVLHFRDAFKSDRYNVRLPRPAAVVDRHLRLGVRERVLRDGTVELPLDDASVRSAAATLREHGVAAVAVALMWSHAQPAHERRVRELLAEELPDVPVLLSSDVLPETGEWVRTSATALSAYVYPATATYLGELERWLAQEGLGSALLVMQINGGCASVAQCLKVPVALTHSGPAAAPVAARHTARRVGETAAREVITIDMGGTSFDVTLVQRGRVPIARGLEIDHQPIGVPGVDLHSIGSGGGSLAWVDTGGALRVGPDSAGSMPGPAAYDNGGTRPTVTDANLVLGYLPETLLGGRKALSRELAEAAIVRAVGEPLGLSPTAAAFGVLRVVEQDMAGAMRAVSIERGIDPRSFLLVAGGGAGPLHAARLARHLGIAEVLIPAEAGGLSSFGMTVTDVRHDYSFALHASSETPQREAVAAGYARLRERADADLRSSGLDPAGARFELSVDARYEGQVHTLIVPVSDDDLEPRALAALRSGFDAAHSARFSYDMPERPVEFLQWRLSAIAPRRTDVQETFGALAPADPEVARRGFRTAVFDVGAGSVETPVFAAGALPAGAIVAGPAILDSETSTIVIPPGDSLRADGAGNFLLTIG